MQHPRRPKERRGAAQGFGAGRQQDLIGDLKIGARGADEHPHPEGAAAKTGAGAGAEQPQLDTGAATGVPQQPPLAIGAPDEKTGPEETIGDPPEIMGDPPLITEEVAGPVTVEIGDCAGAKTVGPASIRVPDPNAGRV